MVILVDFGTDMDSEWSFNSDGDLVLIKSVENIEQAIVNRLNCDLNSLDLYYENYGSILLSFLGWKQSEKTLEFIKLEIENRILQDNRLTGCNSTIEYVGDGAIKIDMEVEVDNEYVQELSLQISENGVENIGNR